MAYRSAPEDLALHGVRVLGFPATSRLAGRYGLDPGTVQELLLDHEARGWVRQLWIQFHEDLLATLGIERGTDT